jgi:hypothetical protein
VANSERTLRKMVAELAEMPVQAREAVLGQLGDAQRERVHTLLDEYRGPDLSPPVPASPIDPRELPAGLSPWLVDLLGDDNAAGRSNDAPLTPHTSDALRACAAELTTVSGNPPMRKGIWQAVTVRLSAGLSSVAAR